ncbi:MAG: hypothetical protein IPM54_09005 [Polyangiaceae bacterium]|nr:hypothetical protein [Polyangiaceae bacterium]
MLSTRVADRFGSYDASGGFFTIPSNVFDADARADLTAMVAPVSRLQLGITVPFVLNMRRIGADTEMGGGIGDFSFSGRFDIVPLSTASSWPAIALTAALAFPTGRSASEATNVLAADATGLGVTEFRPGIFLEHSFGGEANAIVAASVGLRSAANDLSASPSFDLAPRLRLLAAAGPVFDMGLSLSLGVIHEREGAPSIGGVTMPDADRHRTAALAFVGYDLPSRFTLLGSLELDVPVHELGKNEPAYVAISIGLRRSTSWEN